VATGLLWAPAWAAIFTLLIGITSFFIPIRGDAGPIRMIAIIGWVGLVSGALFGVVLSCAESRKSVGDLSLGRAALWGILASAVFPLVTGRADQVFWACPFGFIASVILVAVARNAELREQNQPRRGRDVFAACVLIPLRNAVDAASER